MIYKKFTPCPELGAFVECYFIWDSQEELVKDLMVESPPTGFCSIVFNCGDDYYLENKKYEHLQVPQQFISGQSIYSYKLFLNGKISIAGIVLKPAALATLFGLPTYEYTEERADLKKVFETKFINEYIERIAKATESTERVKLLEAFVMDHYFLNKPKPDYIDEAANLIVEKNGMLNVKEIMENVYMSRRNFERRFFKKVGLSPKYYARIRRIGYTLSSIAGKHKADWPSILNECAFYDQSHFIKDFLEFTGRTPQQYLEDNKELAHLVEKPKQQPIQ
ncbi:helix-turn-helix domain-containing protein [soil metagenome]